MKKFVCNDLDKNGYDIPETGCGEIDHILFDGYEFGDRILEGVMFKAFYEGDELKVDSVADWDSHPYLIKLNKNHWMTIALEYAKKLDVATCPNCKNEVAGPLEYEEE